MSFTCHKHFKGDEERGYVLGAVDGINQTLEDNTLSLQGMAASQFVEPFFFQPFRNGKNVYPQFLKLLTSG